MSRTTKPRSSAVLCAAGLALALVSASGSAQAQGWALNRYEPNSAGDWFFATEFPWYNSTRLLSLGVTADYARDPLVFRPAGSSQAQSVISNMIVLHAHGQIALFDRLGINFSVPISLLQTQGDASTTTTPGGVRAYTDGPVTGDIRLGARLRIFGQADTDAFSLHVGGQVFLGMIPYNDNRHWVTDETIRGRPYLVIAGHPGPIRYSLTAGAHLRPQSQAGSTVMDTDVFVNAGIALALANNRLHIGPEAWINFVPSTLGSAPGNREIHAEVDLGIQYLIANTIQVGIAGGPGLTQGAGTPTARGLLRVAYAPVSPPARPAPPPDTDNDGVIDPQDQCVNEPAGEHPDPARVGCPLSDRDRDGVFDNEDTCVDVPAGDHPDPNRRGCPLPDSDGDGVYDNTDQCVNTAQGEHPDPSRPGCPDGDQDSDGVLNAQDQCREVAAGPHPDPARAGYPIPDRDNDTVPDNVDHCPDQAGAPHPDPNRNGCPGQVRIENGMLRIISPVFFATNRDTILARSNAVLQGVADALRASPDITRISIEGHTDDVGDDARNLDLSTRRAGSVVRWLTTHGVDAARLEAHGYGETRPLTPITGLRGRAQRDARAQNRRVEFRIVSSAGSTVTTTSTTTTTSEANPAVTTPAASTTTVSTTVTTPAATATVTTPAVTPAVRRRVRAPAATTPRATTPAATTPAATTPRATTPTRR